jgi:signal transduction histidine kinase
VAHLFFQQMLDKPGESVACQLRLCHKAGGLRWIEILGTNLLFEPVVGAIVLNTRDITERKLAEDRLRQQNEELLKINAELDRFVYRASHDLRAPLVSLLGLIDITKEEPDAATRGMYFQLMEKSISKLDTFIKGIIDHSRNARMEVTGQVINFESLVEEVWDELKYIQGSDRIRKELSITGDEVFSSDLFRLKIIFSNILSNAIRYSNPQVDSFVLIRVDIQAQESTIELEDNGFGIAEGSLDKIFEMFYRASEKNVGSGLGLYIVREAVQALKGTISVRSQLGKGTTFRVVLPSLLPTSA